MRATLAFVLALGAGMSVRSQKTSVLDPEACVLRARWEPLAESKYGLYGSQELRDLLGAGPSEPERGHPRERFAALLPAEDVELGEPFALEPEHFLVFLRQFHPGATPRPRYGQPGAFGCLIARDDESLELFYRVHAGFQLDADVFLTPAQFEGRLLWERAPGRPLAFSLALPARNTNVDINARIGDHGVADIGFVPVMELALEPAVDGDHARAGGERVELDVARARLRSAFYRFAAIGWLPLVEAHRRAQEQAKPLHVVILFGTLDDESC